MHARIPPEIFRSKRDQLLAVAAAFAHGTEGVERRGKALARVAQPAAKAVDHTLNRENAMHSSRPGRQGPTVYDLPELMKDAEAVREKHASVQAALADELAKAIAAGKITSH